MLPSDENTVPPDVNAPRDADGNTWLHALCRQNAPVAVLRAAVEKHGADVNALNKKGLPPLGAAILYGRPEHVAALIDLGAELFFPVRRDVFFNAVHLAAQEGREGALDIVLSAGGGLHVNSPGITREGVEIRLPALHVAVRDYHYGLVDRLVKAGAFANASAGDGCVTPLFLAIANDSEAAVRRLAQAGADLELRQQGTGRTPLGHAVYNRKHAALRALLSLGADPDAADGGGVTPLMQAAANGEFILTDALIRSGARVDLRRQGGQGETALMLAAGKGLPDIVRLLLKAGADPTLTDAFNKTALGYADRGWNSAQIRASLEEGERTVLQAQFEASYRKYRP